MTRWKLIWMLLLVVILASTFSVHADSKTTSPNSFSLIVSPSPLVSTISPGVNTTLPLQIINNSSQTEYLQISLRDFKINKTTGKIIIGNSADLGASTWIKFSQPKFTLSSGQILNTNIMINTPISAGFSYSYAVIIGSQKTPSLSGAGQIIKGALADFLLLNVNRPGAHSSLQLVSFKTSKSIYAWLPVHFNIKLFNNGNTIVQPGGNIFVKRSANSKQPIDTLTLNPGSGYILPGTDRVLTNNWSDGFPVNTAVTTTAGTSASHLVWNWSDLSKLRLGHYYGEMTAIYNNGTSDVPIQGSVGFWVLPWMIILIILVFATVLIVGLWTIAKKPLKAVRSKVKRKP